MSDVKQSFSPELERAAQDGSEWVYGAVQTDLALVPVSVRLAYLPSGVRQFNNVMDTNGCASRAPNNILETKLTWLHHNGMHPELQKWGRKIGFVVVRDGREVWEVNDAFIEILSGTTRNGNSLKAPVDAVRKYGAIPARLLPLSDDMTWEQYMDRRRITEEMFEIGRQFLRRFSINYEKVATNNFIEALEEDMLDAGLHAWSSPVNDVYPRTEAPLNHAVALADNEVFVLDNYEPFKKKIAKDYKLFEWAYSISITNINPYPDETMKLFEVLSRYGLLAFFAEALKRLNAGVESVYTPDVPVYADDVPHETPTSPLADPAPKQVPVTIVSGVDTHGNSSDWAGGSLDSRKAMFKLAEKIGGEEGLTERPSGLLVGFNLRADFLATIQVESGFNQYAINQSSHDYGIAQFNKNTYLKEYKMSAQEAVDNPERCLRIMAKNFCLGRQRNWFGYMDKKGHSPAKEAINNNFFSQYV